MRYDQKKNILAVIGTRPEAIKMCPLIKELRTCSELRVTVCSTGQHKELLASALADFGVEADIDLGIMRDGQTLSHLTVAAMSELDSVIDASRFDAVLVHGDTATAFCAAISAFYKKIPVCHIEAGLRSDDINNPFPEELYRRTISLISSFHFAPTPQAANNLLEEGIRCDRVFTVGNTVVDAVMQSIKIGYRSSVIDKTKGKRRVFVTAHRRENQGDTMKGIFRAIARLAACNDDTVFVFPVHPSPAVRTVAYEILGNIPNVLLCKPFGACECHNILANSYLVLTDSGGLQEEAAACGVPTLITRGVTERREGIIAGIAALAGTDEEQIFSMASLLLSDENEYAKMKNGANPYGDGHACERIAQILCDINFK